MSGANPEMDDVASGASGSGQLRVEPGARWPKRASVASDFGHRPRVAEAVPPYIALMLGGTVWVGVPELPRLFLTGTEPATR